MIFALNAKRQGQLICRVEGINDRNAATRLRNTWLYIGRDQLPEEAGYFYQSDLLGLRLKTKTAQRWASALGFLILAAARCWKLSAPKMCAF